MNPQTAQQILLALSRGVHPVTGEKLPENHLINDPAISLALLDGANALGERSSQDNPMVAVNRPGLSPGIKPWTEKENDQLLEWYIHKGKTPIAIAKLMKRNKQDVVRQLEHLHFLPKDNLPPQPPERAKRPWTREEEETLLRLYDHHWSIPSLARRLKRSERAIEIRLETLSVIELPPNARGPHRPWPRGDVDKLLSYHEAGLSPDRIAQKMNRDPDAVKARLFYMGLIHEAPRLLPDKDPEMTKP